MSQTTQSGQHRGGPRPGGSRPGGSRRPRREPEEEVWIKNNLGTKSSWRGNYFTGAYYSGRSANPGGRNHQKTLA